MSMLDLTDRVAIITGGGTGIGTATALLFAQHGADVVLAGRQAERLQTTADMIKAETGRRAIGISTDVRNDEAVQNLIDGTIAEYGKLDILVNNAGGAYMFPAKDMAPDRFRNSIELNLISAYLCAHAALPHLIKSPHAAIISMSSAAGVSGVKGGSAYSAGKAGLQMFSRVIAAEWGPKGIRSNVIAVGGVASEGALRSWERFGMDADSMGANVPLRRVGWPIDIARGALYFASDMSSWVTGQTLSIDGGPSGMGGLQDDALWPEDNE
ncbi:MAG: SDR family NAD(P)-dependent oxidoreductase [Candidatus Nanopelagicales bacterium]|nr:SDR family NAD(P)-dependent oxidoreductase [Candidatus Nanopelagicales bacterium]